MADKRTIKRGEVYPLSEFQKITGFKRHAMRQARANGLKVCRFGGRAFIRGQDFDDFLCNVRFSTSQAG